MTIAAIYDIHGNFFALEAVLSEIQTKKIETVVVCGDIVWGPQPRKVMDTLMNYKNQFHFIMGNADREVAHRHDEKQGCPSFIAELNHWCADQLTEEQIEFIISLPKEVSLSIDGLGDILFVHGSPRSDEEAIRVGTPEEEIWPMIKDVKENTIVCGHTHIQFDRVIGNKRIINAGSVGLQSAAKGACWLLIDNDIHLKVTEYNVKEAADRIRAGQCPYKNDFADHILYPPDMGP